MTNADTSGGSRPLLTATMANKVPEILIFFWIIKILATTVGETFADFLNTTIGLGLTGTTIVMLGATGVALWYQLRLDRYVPAVYWLVVTLISVAGTLITDNITDRFGVPLSVTTCIFAVVLVGVFIAWHRSEHTLSIHSIVNENRERYYWAVILFTFALGTAAGDWTAEGADFGFFTSALIYAGLIAVIAGIHFALQSRSAGKQRKATDAVWAFWAAYILTRPLGASLGDLLSQSPDDGGLGIGTTATSALFLVTIAALVVYLTKSKRDQIKEVEK